MRSVSGTLRGRRFRGVRGPIERGGAERHSALADCSVSASGPTAPRRFMRAAHHRRADRAWDSRRTRGLAGIRRTNLARLMRRQHRAHRAGRWPRCPAARTPRDQVRTDPSRSAHHQAGGSPRRMALAEGPRRGCSCDNDGSCVSPIRTAPIPAFVAPAGTKGLRRAPTSLRLRLLFLCEEREQPAPAAIRRPRVGPGFGEHDAEVLGRRGGREGAPACALERRP